MKVAVSLPDELFEEADDAAARLGLNRSALYARALADFLARQGTDPVTARLDELAAVQDSVDGAAAARRLIDAGRWEW
jgi:predicted transcriptional regulator